MTGNKKIEKRVFHALLATSFLFVFASCISETDFAYLNDQVNTLSKRVAELKASQESTEKKLDAELETHLEAIRANQAELNADMDQAREEIRRLSGRVEDNEHLIKRVVERDLSEQDALKENLANLEKRVAELERMIRGGPGVRAPVVAPEEVVPKPAPVEEEAPPTPPKVETRSPELRLYDASLAHYKEGRYEEAIKGFREFMGKYPTSDLADNAHFWIGESYMALKEYEKAILAYQDVITKYPKGNKVPSAMLRQAMAFLEIKDKISAKLLLQKIIKNYPASNEAKIARAKLKQIR